MTDRDPLEARLEEEVSAELRHYLDLRARSLEAQGIHPEEARRMAEHRFGDLERIRSECLQIQRRRQRRQSRRDVMIGWTEDFVQAARGLIRTRVVTATVLATLALGIGANTAVFSVVRGVLLRPLPFDDADQLVVIHEARPEGTKSPSPANYLEWRDGSRTLESLTAWTVRAASLLEGDTPRRLRVGLVSGNFFHTLQADADRGRTFDPALRVDPSIREVVLSHDLWTSSFGADPDVIGSAVRLDESTYEVLGVMGVEFDLPEGVDLWMRAPQEAPGIPGFDGDISQVRFAWYFDVIGRLADGRTIEAAQSEFDAFAARLREQFPDENEGLGVSVRSLHTDIVESAQSLLVLMLGAVGLVLLAACANVANLFLVRADGRRRDFAVRAALGAGRTRLRRFVVTEGLILAVIGGVLGIALAAAFMPMLVDLLPVRLPRRSEIGIDGTVLLFTTSVSLLSCLTFALAPVLLAPRSDTASELTDRSGGGGAGRGARIRGALVVTEVALGVTLAVSTGLVLRSLDAMASVDPGFRADGLATMRVSFPEGTAMSTDARRERWRRLLDELASVPGVTGVGAGIASPDEEGPQAGLNVVRGDPTEINADVSVVWHPASPGFLETLGIPLLRGRPFDDRDRSDGVHVALVSEGLASRFFEDEEAIGETVTIGLDDGHSVQIEIVGVVGDTRNRGPVLEPVPILYRPLAQAGAFGASTMLVAGHGSGDPSVLLANLTDAVNRIDPTAVVYDSRIGSELGSAFFGLHRFVSSLLAVFAALAITLAAVGVYGVTAHAVGRRRHEIGIKMAIGATRQRVWSSVLLGGLRLTGAGVALGLLVAVLGGRVLSSMLFRVEPADPLTLAVVTTSLFFVAAMAIAIPAGQAVRVDPTDAIRGD